MNNDDTEEGYEIGEFVSLKLKTLEKEFEVVLKGDKKYESLILHKMNQIRVTKAEMDEWVE